MPRLSGTRHQNSKLSQDRARRTLAERVLEGDLVAVGANTADRSGARAAPHGVLALVARKLGDQSAGLELREEVQERLFCRLEDTKASLAAVFHVGHHFDWPPQIEVGMPRRC